MKLKCFVLALLLFANYSDAQNAEDNLRKAWGDLFPSMSAQDMDSLVTSFMCRGPYNRSEDSKVREGVPKGELIKKTWNESSIYPGTKRNYWIYVPDQYDPENPACLMIFQDGEFYMSSPVWAPTVLDNLIHKGDIPVIIGLFINPGDKGDGVPIWGGTDNRSKEYDEVSDKYARFLIEEMIPELMKDYSITDKPDGRALAGLSSGGICSFTAAWHRPDQFRKVISHCGSYTNMRGGHIFPILSEQPQRNP
jgi:enterochelin esterase family protein